MTPDAIASQQRESSVLHSVHGHVVQPVATVKPRQLPSTQTSSTSHCVPQSPQWSGSLDVATHAPSQFMVPPGHVPPMHALALQSGVAPVHAVVQVPQ